MRNCLKQFFSKQALYGDLCIEKVSKKQKHAMIVANI